MKKLFVNWKIVKKKPSRRRHRKTKILNYERKEFILKDTVKKKKSNIRLIGTSIRA